MASASADSSEPDHQAHGSQRQGDETFSFSIKGHTGTPVSGTPGSYDQMSFPGLQE